MASKGAQPILYLSTGENDLVGEKVRNYLGVSKVLRKVMNRGEIPGLSGILTRKSVGNEWLSKVITVNYWIPTVYKGNK